MENSKLIILLNTLSKSEIRAFGHFLQCKLFNQRENAIILFSYIKAELKSSKPKLDKKTVYAALFPNVPYKDRVIQDMMYHLTVPLDKFLTFIKMYDNEGDELIALCKAYRERSVLQLFETAVSKTASIQNSSKLRDSEYHHRNYLLQQEQYKASTQKGRGHQNNLNDVATSLDISYFANRLRQSCYMLSHQSVYNIAYDFTLVDEIIKEVNRKQLLHIPAISIYYYCFLAQRYPDQLEYYNALRNTLVAHANLFTLTEMKDIYLLAINTAIRRFNLGSSELIPDLLELYRSGIEQKILLTNNVLSRFTYKNMIALALYTTKYDWAKEIMETYTNLLEPRYREISYQFNIAKYHYSKGEYSDALQLLFLLNSNDDVYMNINTKILLSRIYYEQNELDALDALIDSFKKALSRKKEIMGYHLESYRNFVQSLNKLVQLNSYDRIAKRKLLKEIENTQPIADKYWFLKQLE